MIWNNVKNIPNRLMATWLRRRGWVVFYLDEQARFCLHTTQDNGCWLRLYQEEEAREGRGATGEGVSRMSESDLRYWQERAEAAEAIVKVLFRQVAYRPDHACGKCISSNDISSDMKKPGFQCAYHRAARFVETTERRDEV